MEDQTTTAATPERKALTFDLGKFEGFSFRDQAAILRPISAEEVVNWDHDRDGEAEFWPSGDVPEVALLFKGRSSVSGSELLDLDRILAEMDPQSLGGKVPRLEFFDLKSDPDEMRNLVADPGHRAELARLYNALRQWVKDTKDPAVQPPETAPIPKPS